MIHLLPHWNWKEREGEVTPIYVYSNCPKVELFVNGKSQGIEGVEKIVTVILGMTLRTIQERLRLSPTILMVTYYVKRKLKQQEFQVRFHLWQTELK